MPGRIPRDDQDGDDYYTQYDHGRRHRSQPPKKNRVREEDRPQRPKFAKDDSYYNPRDKYYLSGDDVAEDHPYYARLRDDSPPRRRAESPRRSRHESTIRYESPPRYESPRRQREVSRSRDQRHGESYRSVRSRSSEDHRRQQRYADDEYDRHSRHSGAAAVGTSRHRSSTTVPPPRSDDHDYDHDRDHDGDRRSSRHESGRSRHRYPPSASKTRGPHRSATLPVHRPRSSSRDSSSHSPHLKSPPEKVFAGAARAALQAGTMAALKLVDDDGPWIGKKGTKVVTTALGAGLVDTFFEARKPEAKGGARHSMAKQFATFAIGSLVKPAARHGLVGHKVKEGM